ncbi:TetR/AcrR family transcriptional regulator [[Mycobacterium] nativiensis]|uniref:TetR family transcriptional regulator n=1 Tax=[Mycobacterium] nativiensis TaxID=2855503 RepID=A0ABU5XWY8_9MYCO|nr:TetR/AcrR family transcriptional regulator [Mycolicibacter sp. MYC340]MEB3032302.1 TetR family transcriptional regulator [Mycolicibacter sp. MYC340]
MAPNPLFALLGTSPEAGAGSAADAQILQAALDQFALTGVRRTSTDDIARRAGVNRATLYRRLGAKTEIVSAAFLYEAGRVLTEIDSGTGDLAEHPTDAEIDDYIVRFCTLTLAQVRENRLLHQLLEVDRDETLRALTVGAGRVVEMASAFLAERIRLVRERTGGSTDAAEIGSLSAVLARMTQSLLLTPDGPPHVRTADEMAAFSASVLIPLFRGQTRA